MDSRRRMWRVRKLVDRRLQLKMTFWFLLTCAATVGLQFVLTVNTMTDVALRTPLGSGEAYDATATGAVRVLIGTLLVSIPLMTVVGVLVSFRVTGPLVRFRSFLEAVRRGESPPDVRLREGDELHDLAELLNVVTRPLREKAAEESEPESKRAA